jgi:signal transduction histidine kinase
MAVIAVLRDTAVTKSGLSACFTLNFYRHLHRGAGIVHIVISPAPSFMSHNISTDPADDLPVSVREVQKIGAVGQILETVAALTGLGFVAVAHVTDNSWTTCAVLDELGFGLKVGDGLDVTTTLCEEVRATACTIVIDHVRENDRYRDHHTPRIYGFQSYFSIPIFRPDGAYFGTLCGLDPSPAQLSAPATVSTLELFAQLISQQLEVEQAHAAVQSQLLDARETAELREQFIAVLGHDLRTPLGAIQNGVELLRLKHPDPDALPLLQRMQRSVGRITALVDDVVDFTRGRMGGGIALNMRHEKTLVAQFSQVIEELRELHPGVAIVAHLQPGMALLCDAGRLAQLLSNLLKNAIVHGEPGAPVVVTIGAHEGRFSIAVGNRGADLAPELVAQLFKPFWRAPARGAHEGLGLGLYIVSEIARSHGGAMEVTSRDGQVTFIFSMPDHGWSALRVAG